MTSTELPSQAPLEALARLARELRKAKSLEAVGSAVSQALHGLAGAPVVCLLYRVSARGFELASACQAGWLTGDPTVRRKLQTELSRLAATGAARRVSTLSDRDLAEDLRQAGAHTVLGVTLAFCGDTRGLLGVLFPRRTVPPDDGVMAVLASLAAGALGTIGAPREAGAGTSEPSVVVRPGGDGYGPGRSSGPARRVLVIADEDTVREFLATALGTLGHDVTVAASTTEALASLSSEPPPDVVLFDLSIPGEDAASSYEALRRALPEARLILASGHVEARARSLVPAAADAPYLGKPFRVRALRGLIEG